jgi:predicted RNA binding protein with dsRBD fold (UPF0201 family)
MTGKTKTAGKFKSKATSILESQKPTPDSMAYFLKDTQLNKTANTQLHKGSEPKICNPAIEDLAKPTNGQMHITSKSQNELGRIHIQIRQDLIEKLLDTVFKRKRNRKIKNRDATQRAVIEEALEMYFMQDRM